MLQIQLSLCMHWYLLPKRYAFMPHRHQCECVVLHSKFSAQNTCLTTPHLTIVYIHIALTSIPESVIMCDIVQQIIDLSVKSFICMWHLHTQKIVYSITVFVDGTCLLVKGLQSCFISQHLVTAKFIAFAFHIFN